MMKNHKYSQSINNGCSTQWGCMVFGITFYLILTAFTPPRFTTSPLILTIQKSTVILLITSLKPTLNIRNINCIQFPTFCNFDLKPVHANLTYSSSYFVASMFIHIRYKTSYVSLVSWVKLWWLRYHQHLKHLTVLFVILGGQILKGTVPRLRYTWYLIWICWWHQERGLRKLVFDHLFCHLEIKNIVVYCCVREYQLLPLKRLSV